ncbi:GntR family transcriptional regulator [Chelativorans alearense]|uniref:GntR family transcriptional regulator n=1 Tax=Chelativorans alearense TaxID=2681495 RepID=UPI0013D022F3|nr:GntR family transcriptional regulator [Chelativorans alearense]
MIQTVARTSSSAITLADTAEGMVLSDILSGVLAPGERLILPSLAKRTGIGLTPLREALSRLTRRGMVVVEGNRGFRVATISREDLADITTARIAIETAALRLSMERQHADWIDHVVAADHRLTRTIRQFEGPISENIEAYDEAHRRFHYALVAGCGSDRLLDMQTSLYDQAYRYRRLLVVSGMDPERAIAEHAVLVELALGGDVNSACAALARHLKLTSHVFSDD